MKILLTTLAAINVAWAFPWVSNMPGVDSSMLGNARRNVNTEHAKRQGSCPFKARGPGAAPYDPKYPYTGARDGNSGTQVGGIKVPADGNIAHAFEPPDQMTFGGRAQG